jgi:hypothetical protein
VTVTAAGVAVQPVAGAACGIDAEVLMTAGPTVTESAPETLGTRSVTVAAVVAGDGVAAAETPAVGAATTAAATAGVAVELAAAAAGGRLAAAATVEVATVKPVLVAAPGRPVTTGMLAGLAVTP